MKKSPRKRIVQTIDKDVSKDYFQATVRDGNYKFIWGSSDLFKTISGKQETKEELFNIEEDPYENDSLNLKKFDNIVKKMKRIIQKEWKRTKFPEHYKAVRAAFPGNNNGNFTTGWC